MTNKYFNFFLEWVKQPKNYRWLIPLFVFLVMIFLLKGFFTRDKSNSGDYEIARDSTWYPLTFFGKQKNMLGFADDLIFQIAQRKGLKIRLVSETPGELLNSLERNADGIFSSLSPDVILQEKYLFSEPFYNLGAVLVVKANSPVKSLNELEGKFLGVSRGSNVLFLIPSHPNMHVIPYDSLTTMIDDVVKDKIDGALLNQLNAYNFANGYYKGRLKVATHPLTNEGLRLITRTSRRDIKLINDFNEGLSEMKADGSYHTLLEKWDLNDPASF